MATLQRQGDQWRARESLIAGQTSAPVIFPTEDAGDRQAVVAVYPAFGAGARIEYTVSDRSSVQQGTADWLPWPQGDVYHGSADLLDALPTAVRCTALEGAAEWEVVVL